MGLHLQPITLREASAFVTRHHRHHGPTRGWLFGVAVHDGDRVVGVAVVGRPVSAALQDGWTCEVTRCCTDGTPHAASKLYAACHRAARALGYRRCITYLLADEPGTSVKATGWRFVRLTEETRGWDRPGRPRVDAHPLGQKQLWEAVG